MDKVYIKKSEKKLILNFFLQGFVFKKIELKINQTKYELIIMYFIISCFYLI